MGKMIGKGDLTIDVTDAALEAGCKTEKCVEKCGGCGRIEAGVKFSNPNAESVFRCWSCLGELAAQGSSLGIGGEAEVAFLRED